MKIDSVGFKDFFPINRWQAGTACFLNGKWAHFDIIDQTTGKSYWHESKNMICLKCFLLLLATPLAHTINAIDVFSYRLFSVLTFSSFREKEATFSQKLQAFKVNLIALFTFKDFLGVVALELCALYGILRPLDGRKLYASFERRLSPCCNEKLSYEKVKKILRYLGFNTRDERALIAPCFQPDPEYHLFNQKNW